MGLRQPIWPRVPRAVLGVPLMLRPLLVPAVSVGQADGRGPAATFPVRLGLSFAARWLWAGLEPCPALLSAVSRVPPLVLCPGLALHWPPLVLPWRQVELAGSHRLWGGSWHQG